MLFWELIPDTVIYGRESWTIKKAEHQRQCFWTVVLEKTLKNLLDSKEIKLVNPRGNQPWIFTGRAAAEAEAPILWSPDAKSQLLEQTLMLRKIEGKRRRGQQRMRLLNSIIYSMGMSLNKLWETVEDRGGWCAAVHGIVTEQQQSILLSNERGK